MKRAQLYLWSVLHSGERLDGSVLPDVAGKLAIDLPIADREQRRADMEAAVGAWAERIDIPPSSLYISRLRTDAREPRLSRI